MYHIILFAHKTYDMIML